MSATKVPSSATLPDPAPVITKEWAPGVGESEFHEWPLGTAEEIDAIYQTKKSEAEAGNGTQSLTYRNANGRASLVARFVRRGNASEAYGEDVTIVEELYAMDVIKDIAEAPYWDSLTGEVIAWIRYCADNRLNPAEITTEAQRLNYSSSLEWGSWSNLMKSFWWHLLHGVETYFETAFALRRSLYGIRTSQVQASFTNINTKVTAPTFESAMDDLIESLPSGEWLYRPPQAENLGKGRWRVTLEWQWALKWSVMYGGTWNGTA